MGRVGRLVVYLGVGSIGFGIASCLGVIPVALAVGMVVGSGFGYWTGWSAAREHAR